MLGVDDSYTGPNKWQVSVSWRYQKSDRHFIGTEEQKNREEEGSQVINTIHQAEVVIRYNATSQWSVALGIPYLIAERSNPILNSNRQVVARSITQTRDLGDVTLVARKLLWKPLTHPDGNVSLGLGIKLPTGKDNVVDARQRRRLATLPAPLRR